MSPTNLFGERWNWVRKSSQQQGWAHGPSTLLCSWPLCALGGNCTWVIAGFGCTALLRDSWQSWDYTGCRTHGMPLGRQSTILVL